MEQELEREVEYYYDMHPTQEDLMGETSFHNRLIGYLVRVLDYLFRDRLVAVHSNLNFYQTPNRYEYPLAPDIAVIKGVANCSLRSWKIGRTGPAPQVVIEIASEETWRKDMYEKPAKYAAMGVQEYFLYDPNEPPLWRMGSRLMGWQVQGDLRELEVDEQGRLWSEQLESFFVPDGEFLRLYDRDGHRRLTKEEAEEQRAERAEWLVEKEAQAKRKALEIAEREAQRAARLAEKLRALGINPDALEQ
jgi:Uma2 family endonuclease